MYPIVVSDLDGTLLASNHKVSSFTKRTLVQLAAQDIKFIMATGRHYKDVDKIRANLGLDIYLITSNGARVHDPDGKVIFRQDLQIDIVDELVKTKVDNDVCINLYQDDKWLINKEQPNLLKYQQDSAFGYQVCDLRKVDKTNTSKVFFYGPPEKLLNLVDDIKLRLGDRINIAFSTVDSLEIMEKDVSKGKSLTELAKLIGYGVQDCIAFGDGMNDVEMLSAVGRGLIMDNASMMLKRALPLLERVDSNDNDGVANYLRHLYLLDRQPSWINHFYKENPNIGFEAANY